VSVVPLGLGLDAGGTATRWALSDAQGHVLAQGQVAGLSGLMLGSGEGKARFVETLQDLQGKLPQAPMRVWFGLTGAGEGFDMPQAIALSAAALCINPAQLRIASDMVLLHQLHFAPGAGHVLYAGTGSYASFWDGESRMQHVGGRGALLDDAGSGCWIGLEALRAVWRAEETGEPRGGLAHAVFAHLGSDAWPATRALVYGQALSQSRGGIAAITHAVAGSESADPLAHDILKRAGLELARLGIASVRRHGAKPLALAGRVLLELPTVQSACMGALADSGLQVHVQRSRVHIAPAAAQRAAQSVVGVGGVVELAALEPSVKT
jgi:glucosamine kinase